MNKYLFCYVIDKSFNLPLLFMADSIEKNLSYEIDFRREMKNQVYNFRLDSDKKRLPKTAK